MIGLYEDPKIFLITHYNHYCWMGGPPKLDLIGSPLVFYHLGWLGDLSLGLMPGDLHSFAELTVEVLGGVPTQPLFADKYHHLGVAFWAVSRTRPDVR